MTGSTMLTSSATPGAIPASAGSNGDSDKETMNNAAWTMGNQTSDREMTQQNRTRNELQLMADYDGTDVGIISEMRRIEEF